MSTFPEGSCSLTPPMQLNKGTRPLPVYQRCSATHWGRIAMMAGVSDTLIKAAGCG